MTPPITGPRVVVAPDKFKGSLTALAVAARVAVGLRAVRADLDVVPIPVADGGDGTVDAAVAAGFDRVPIIASGPTGAPVATSYARRGDEAVVELASVCGLMQLPAGVLAAETASSYGLGEVVLAAVRAGARRVVLGLGGSASTDGGAGFLQALGLSVVGVRGAPVGDGAVRAGGAGLADIVSIDLDDLAPELRGVEVVVAGDVDNPLTGPNGAAAVYGPQKGADPAQVDRLAAGLAHWARIVAAATGADHADDPGAGAAGGVGFAALAVLGAAMRPGIELVLDLVGLPAHLVGAALVITGEGSLDAQSLAGKAPIGVAAAARAAGVPAVAVCGQNRLSPAQLHGAGIDAAYAINDIEPDLGRCLADAGHLLELLGATVARAHLPASPQFENGS